MNDKARQAVAEVLYDELTGRYTGEGSQNAALRPVSFKVDGADERDQDIHELAIRAMSHGLELHYSVGDRWSLAKRLADKALAAAEGAQ